MLGRKIIDPIFIAERELGALRERKVKLTAALDHANGRLEDELSARRRQLVESDDDVGGQVRTIVAQLRDDADAVRDALDQVNQRIAGAEAQLAAERQRVEREIAARALTADADTLAAALASFASAGADLLAAVGSVAPRVPHAALNAEWAKFVLDGLATSALELVAQGKTQAVQIASGHSEILLPTVMRPEPPPLPEIPRQEVYSHRRLSWAEGDRIVTCERYCFAWLPIAAAARAIALNVASERRDERTTKIAAVNGASYGSGGDIPATDCFFLDTEPVALAG